ncbi:hypothetical protein D9M71_635660 [compost metagenome]
MLNITLTLIQARHFTTINIDTQDIETDSVIAQHQRQADITKPNDSDQSFPVFELIYAGLLVRRHP